MAFAKVYWIRIYDSPLWRSLSKSAKAVLYVLMHRADENYVSYPSLPMLESDTGYEVKAILKAIEELKSKKAVVLKQRNGAHNHYITSMWKPENLNDKKE